MMDAVKFLEELHRMCTTIPGCEVCALQDRLTHCPAFMPDAKEAVSIVEKWSAEHPVKTRLMDFLEKFPNASLSSEGLPLWLPRPFGYCGLKMCYDCEHQGTEEDCWNLPLEEE